MKTFSELKGVAGIDTLNECVPYVDEILSDRDTLDEVGNMTWFEAAIPMYKKHTEAFHHIFDALGIMAETSTQIVTAAASVMSEVFQNDDVRRFFMNTCKSVRSMIRAMANTEDEQSAGT